MDVEGGHDGCDTRNGILKRDLRDVEVRPGTNGCVVLSGELTDPYTGQEVEFSKQSGAGLVTIDHVFPLAAAWSRGASTWSSQRRRDFANDPRNLLATAAATNQAKSDKMPDLWVPGTLAGQCRYATQFAEAARAYQLLVTRAEYSKLQSDLSACGTAKP